MASLLSVGQIIDRTFDHYKKHFKELIAILLWIVIASIPTVASKLIALAETNPEVTAGDWAAIVLSFIGVISVAVISMWVYINLILTVSDQASGRNPDLKKTYTTSWRLWLKYLLLNILIALAFAVMAAFSLPGLILLFTSAINTNATLSAIGTPLLLVGGALSLYSLLRFSVPLAFAPYMLLLEKSHPVDSIKQSIKLVKGRWLATFIRFVIPKFIYTLIFLAINYVTFAIFQVLFTVVANTSDFLTMIVYAISLFLSLFISVMVTPLVVANDYYLYDSLRKTR